jgi:glycosyltransferase involved in cell wall biosynthesis
MGKNKQRLVWFSEVQWDFLSTRKQRLLARFPDSWDILFIEPFTLGRQHHWIPVRRGRVFVVTAPFLKRVPFAFGRLLNIPVVRFLVGIPGVALMLFWALVLGFSGRNRVIGLSNVYWGPVAARLPARLRFYDANDDHLAFPDSPPWLAGYRAAWLQRAELMFSVSCELSERIAPPLSVRVVSLGNGVEYERFSEPRREVPPLLREAGGEVLGYLGAMDWLDVPLLVRVAKRWPKYSIVLVGPAYQHGWWERQQELRLLPNVRYAGLVAYDEVPAWVQHFSLALMPMQRSPLKRASDPNKLYEYTAAGVPVLAMNYCEAVDKAQDVVAVAETEEEFVEMVPEALADSREEGRREFARQHSWDALAAAMVGELLRALQERAE